MITYERSEPARERRIELYKSDHQEQEQPLAEKAMTKARNNTRFGREAADAVSRIRDWLNLFNATAGVVCGPKSEGV